MKSTVKAFLLLCLIFGIAGCAAYHVDVTGYLDPEHPPSLNPGKTVFVVQNEKADNPLLEKEVASKIARLLQQKEYRLSAPEDADFRLVFAYGMDIGPLRVKSFTRREPDRTDVVYRYDDETGKSSWQTVTIPGPISYQTYSVRNYTCFLSIRVIDARKFRQSGEVEVVWAADTVSEGGSSDVRDVLNYLLVATFEYFGQDTGKAVRVKLAPEHPRVKCLMNK